MERGEGGHASDHNGARGLLVDAEMFSRLAFFPNGWCSRLYATGYLVGSGVRSLISHPRSAVPSFRGLYSPERIIAGRDSQTPTNQRAMQLRVMNACRGR